MVDQLVGQSSQMPGQSVACKKPLKKAGDQVQYEATPQAKWPVKWRLSHSSFWFTGIGNKCS